MNTPTKLALIGLIMYVAASSGLLVLWCDETGCGVQIYSPFNEYYSEGMAL
jgi:hypothetical protein